MKKKYFFLVLIFVLALFSCKTNSSKVGNVEKEEKKETTPQDNSSLFEGRYREMVFFDSQDGMPIKMGQYDERQEEIKSSFYIGKYEVTVEFYTDVAKKAKNKGYVFINEGNEDKLEKDKPISTITWFDSIVWCNAASYLAGLKPLYIYKSEEIKDAKKTYDAFKKSSLALSDIKIAEGVGYRLPYQVEWEACARYLGDVEPANGEFVFTEKDGKKYYFCKGHCMSGTLIKASDVPECEEVAWFAKNSGAVRHNVGEKKANFLGIHDMSGNVAEWTCEGGEYDRIVKGGAYNMHNQYGGYLQVGMIFPEEVHVSPDYIGFRIVKTN